MEYEFNVWGVLLAAVSTFVIGGLWYSALFAKQWQGAAGVSDEQLKSGAMRIAVGSGLLALVMAASLSMFIGAEGLAFGVFAGFMTGLTFVAAAFGVNYLFERKPLRLFLINGGYNVVAFTAMGAILGAMQG